MLRSVFARLPAIWSIGSVYARKSPTLRLSTVDWRATSSIPASLTKMPTVVWHVIHTTGEPFLSLSLLAGFEAYEMTRLILASARKTHSTQHVSTLLRLQTPRECAASFPPGQMQRDPTFRHLQSSVASRTPDCCPNVPLSPHSPCAGASLLDRAGLLRHCPDNKRPWASLPRANHPQPRAPPDYLMGATSRCTGLRCRFTPMRTMLPCVSPCTRRLLSTV